MIATGFLDLNQGPLIDRAASPLPNVAELVESLYRQRIGPGFNPRTVKFILFFVFNRQKLNVSMRMKEGNI